MTQTKEQITALVDSLADTFDNTELGECFEGEDGTRCCITCGEPQTGQYPILLGDVLAKIKDAHGLHATSKFRISPVAMLCGDRDNVGLWDECGLDKSLQQIIEKSGYDQCRPSEYYKQLFSANARALLAFIGEIFNSK